MKLMSLRHKHPLFLTWWSVEIIIFWISIQQTTLSTASTFDGDEWSMWSAWTPCSRTCEGGITQQYRRCKSSNGCHGVSIRRKMCNMQSCEEKTDYRSEQCQAFNGVLYKGRPRSWEAVEDPDYPCVVTCRAEGTDIIAKLSPKLRDGTRCKTGGLHVCVDGICEQVGCDLKIGSPKKVDECGICGGDNSACNTPAYRWALTSTGKCSATCGGGIQPAKVHCRNSLTDEKVDPYLCNSAEKPHRAHQSCNIHPCEPDWEVGDWSECSVTCGGGMQIRRVFCAQEKNSTKIQVSEKLCHHIHKPPNQQSCNTDLCPHWHVGPWSACSASCGESRKTRNVVCRDAQNLPSSNCDIRLLPANVKICEASPSCSTPTEPQIKPTESINEPYESNSNVTTITDENVTELTTMTMPTKLKENIYPTFPDIESEFDYLDTLEELPREHTLPLIQPYPMDTAVLFDQNAVPSEPTYVAEPWGACSQTCGEGIRKREVNCKIFLEFTRTVANLPDKECFGPKPLTFESCYSQPCPLNTNEGNEESQSLSDSHHAALADSDSSTYRKTVGFGLPPGITMQDMTFSWKVDGYTPCSASCLGGVQERRIICVRDFDQRAATPVLCMDKPRPDIPTTRTCNDHPCPPRWNVSDFSPCSKSCGGGVMVREVSCIHEVTRGNTVTVPNTQCPSPEPRTERLCNAINCPPYWETGEWNKCSKPCDGGVRNRKLGCKQIIALGQVVERIPAETHCTQPPPLDTRSCNKKPCSRRKGNKDASKPNDAISNVSNSSFIFIQNEWKPKLTLTVRGQATVYNEILLRLRCPAKNIDRSRISWMKDYHYVHLVPNKIEIIPKAGTLKIINTTFSDSGLYTCLANDQPLSNVTLMVHPYSRVGFDNRNFGKGQQNTVNNNIESWPTRGKSGSNEGTLYADQQPGVSVGPIYVHDSDREGHQSNPSTNVFTQNTNLFSGSSAGSSLKPPFYYILQELSWVLWPLTSIINSKENQETKKQSINENVYAYYSNSEKSELQFEGIESSESNIIVRNENLDNLENCISIVSLDEKRHRVMRRVPTGTISSSNHNHYNKEKHRHSHQHANNNSSTKRNDYEETKQSLMKTKSKRSSKNNLYNPEKALKMCAKEISSNRSYSTDSVSTWKTSDWAECFDENCFTWNTSIKKRDVYCIQHKNKIPTNSKNLNSYVTCRSQDKPVDSEECFNPNCRGIWVTEEWSHCTAPCGTIGFKTRILKCVWFGSLKPAGNACHSMARPSVRETCQGSPCTKMGCKDKSSHCPGVIALNLCHSKQYHQFCCESCSKLQFLYKNRSRFSSGLITTSSR